MRPILAMIPMLLAASCASVNEAAICDGTQRARDAHTVALLDDGGPRSQTTGARLIGLLDAGCGDT